MSAEGLEAIARSLAAPSQPSRGDAYDGIWPEHAAIVEAFLVCVSQWRVVPVVTTAGSALVYTGLDYAGCRAGLDAAGIAVTPDLWAGLAVMETEAAATLNGRRG